MIKKILIGAALMTTVIATGASATPFTRTSLTSAGLVPAGVTEIGGIAIDMIGLNDARVVSQLAASSLFLGFAGSNPQTIGTQTGFTPAIVSSLGGGLKEIAIRFTLFDGDTASGNFDDGDNTLLIDGTDVGNWSSVATQTTSANGLVAGSSSTGFRDNTLDTGWFFNNNAATLAAIFASLADGELTIALNDVDPFDNFYDFTQGVDGGLINSGQGPTLQGPTLLPEPGMLAIFGLGVVGLGIARGRKQAA